MLGVDGGQQQQRQRASTRDARTATRLVLATAALYGASQANDDADSKHDKDDGSSKSTTTTIDVGRVRRAASSLLDVTLELLQSHGDARVLVAALECVASVAECDALLLLRVTASRTALVDAQDAFVLRTLYPLLDALSHPNPTYVTALVKFVFLFQTMFAIA